MGNSALMEESEFLIVEYETEGRSGLSAADLGTTIGSFTDLLSHIPKATSVSSQDRTGHLKNSGSGLRRSVLSSLL